MAEWGEKERESVDDCGRILVAGTLADRMDG